MRKAQERIMREMFEEGATIRQVAAVLDVSTSTVCRMKRLLNAPKTSERWTVAEDESVWDMHRKGYTVEEIALELNRSFPSVEARIVKLRKKRQTTNPRVSKPHLCDWNDLPPLTDWPKHPGCQCGYCPHFYRPRMTQQGIMGTCAVLQQMTQRSDFCIADEEPLQTLKFPILIDGKIKILVGG